MGLSDFFDDKKADEMRQLKHEIADLGHNLKRVMDHLGLEYERNPLLEVSAQALAALQRGDDAAAVAITAQDRGIDEAAAAEGLRVIKPRLGLGELGI
ncbi:MAG: hypothetical protein WCP28_02035 [Actinomycetes bacterium]